MNNNLAEMHKLYHKKVTKKEKNSDKYKIYTPEMINNYKDCFERILKVTNDKTRTKFIMYNKILKWYKYNENINIHMEKIHIKSKLGSYTSGGCGIGASMFAGLTASGIFSYMDNYIKSLTPIFFAIYSVLLLFFGVRILSHEDDKVEMYNMFLEVLNSLEYDNNEN